MARFSFPTDSFAKSQIIVIFIFYFFSHIGLLIFLILIIKIHLANREAQETAGLFGLKIKRDKKGRDQRQSGERMLRFVVEYFIEVSSL